MGIRRETGWTSTYSSLALSQRAPATFTSKSAGPPRIRVDGRLRPLDETRLTEADLAAVVDQVCAASPERRDGFRDAGELDISYTGSGSRFRVNGYRQRGTAAFVFRLIPNQAPTFDELVLPPESGESSRSITG